MFKKILSAGSNSKDGSVGLSLNGNKVNIKSYPVVIYGYSRDQSKLIKILVNKLKKSGDIKNNNYIIVPYMPETNRFKRWYIKTAMQLGTNRKDWDKIVSVHSNYRGLRNEDTSAHFYSSNGKLEGRISIRSNGTIYVPNYYRS